MAFRKGQSGNPGGRPRTRDKHAGAIAKAEQKIAQQLPTLVDNLLTLANGVWTEETGDEGKRLVYQQPPDRKANEYLLNRIMGRPTERKEISGANGAPVAVEFYSYDALAAELETGPEADHELRPGE